MKNIFIKFFTTIEIYRDAILQNEAVSTYNGRIKPLPENLFAGAVGFHEAPFYDPDKLVEAKNFNTDDGTLVREMILKGTKSTGAAVKNATDTVSKKINEAKEQTKEEPKQEEHKQEETKQEEG